MKRLGMCILAFLCVFVIFSLVTRLSLAQSPQSFDLPVEKIIPGNPNYKYKRLKEKVKIVFKLSHSAKFKYRQELVEKRLSELVGLIEIKSINEIANASQRFAYQAGVLAENSYDGDLEDKEIIITLFEKYKPVLEKMRDNFPANSPFWLLTQQDIDTLNILSARLK